MGNFRVAFIKHYWENTHESQGFSEKDLSKLQDRQA